MDIRIEPAVLKGTVEAVSSKSAAHRIMIMAALCAAPTLLLLNSQRQHNQLGDQGKKYQGDAVVLDDGVAEVHDHAKRPAK